MSIFTFFRNIFVPKASALPSELSNPTQCKRELRMNRSLGIVLMQLGRYITPASSHDFLKDTGIWSADKRLSDLKKLGYAHFEIRIEGSARRAYWTITESGTDFLNSLTK